MSNNTTDVLPKELQHSRLLSTKQAQEMLGVGKVTLFKMLRNKKDPLPSFKIGRLRKFRLDQLTWYIDKHSV
jgi:excisionase family DNA binding protein